MRYMQNTKDVTSRTLWSALYTAVIISNVIFNRLIKMVHFIPLKDNQKTVNRLAKIFINKINISRVHVLSKSIVFDRDKTWLELLYLGEIGYNNCATSAIDLSASRIMDPSKFTILAISRLRSGYQKK